MTLRSPKVDSVVKCVRIRRRKKLFAEYLPQEEEKMGLRKKSKRKE